MPEENEPTSGDPAGGTIDPKPPEDTVEPGPIPGTITLPGQGVAKPEVKQKLAWRVLIGRFVARWIETFVTLAGTQVIAIIALPPGEWSFNVLVQLVGPTLTALLQAGRSVWPTLQSWLNNGGQFPDDVNTVAAT